MMSIDIKEETNLFAELLRKTDIYLEYTEARNAIKQDPELYRKVNEFRQRNFDLQHNTREEDLMDAADAFERENEEFRANPLVDRFLGAELALCRMLQEVSLQVIEEMDFE